MGSLILALEDDIPISKSHFICFEAYYSILNNRYFNRSNGNHFWVSMSDATSNRSEFFIAILANCGGLRERSIVRCLLYYF